MTAVGMFNGTNYRQWKYATQLALEERGLWKIVKGEEVQPDESQKAELDAYKARGKKAYAAICLSLGNDAARDVMHLRTATEVWRTLENIYQPKNVMAILRLKKQLFNTKMNPGDLMRDHIHKICEIAAELADINEPVAERELVHIILNSLPRDYDDLIDLLIMEGECLGLGYLKARLLDKEQRQKAWTTKNINV